MAGYKRVFPLGNPVWGFRTVAIKEYTKTYAFDDNKDLKITVHNVYDYHGQFIGYGGYIRRVSGTNIMLVWSGDVWICHKSNLKSGARMLLKEFLESQRKKEERNYDRI